MAFVVNRSQVTKVCVKREIDTGLGVQGTMQTPTGGTDDLLAFTNANPLLPQFAYFDALENAFTGTLSLPAGVTTTRTVNVNLEFLMQGHGSAAADWTVNGYKSIDALLCSCGLYRTKYPAAVPPNLTYAPATIAQMEAYELGAASVIAGNGADTTSIGACTVWCEVNGFLIKTSGVMGNIVFEGSPTTGLIARYSGVGLYDATTYPVATGTIANFTGGTSRHAPFLNAGASFTGTGFASGYTAVVHSLRFDLGTQNQGVTDINSASGLKNYYTMRRRPIITATIAMESGANTSAAVNTATLAEWYTAMKEQTLVASVFTVKGSGSGNYITFNAPKGRVIGLSPGVDGARRTLEITILCTGANSSNVVADTSEFSIVVADT